MTPPSRSALVDRADRSTSKILRHGAHAPAALVSVLWYPDRPISFLATRLRISHPGAVQLVDRLQSDGLLERIPGVDGRTKLLYLTDSGRVIALQVLSSRREAADTALAAVNDKQLQVLTGAAEIMLEALTDDLLVSEHMCRLCDELACPDSRCPVERAEPSPPHRRGFGYGVGAAQRDRN
jgi:MarR family transcriptional repressor of emrRAB